MDKLKSAIFITTAVLTTNIFATTTPQTMMVTQQSNVLFATGEGAYTWNSIGDTTVNDINANKSSNGWGGRIAAGVAHHSCYDPNFSYTAELGWGYYGKTNITLPVAGINAQNQIYGLDALIGADYKINLFDVFFKVGGMLENVRMNRNTDLTKLVEGGSVIGTSNEITNMTSVIPEIKIGGVYNITNQWGVSLAYMYVFGNGNVNQSINKTFDGTTIHSTTSMTTSPIALSTLMFGLRYSFE